MKAYLICKGAHGWGHDLDTLRMQCAAFDDSYLSVRYARHCAFLTAFAAVRYPDYTASVNVGDATRGIEQRKADIRFRV